MDSVHIELYIIIFIEQIKHMIMISTEKPDTEHLYELLTPSV